MSLLEILKEVNPLTRLELLHDNGLVTEEYFCEGVLKLSEGQVTKNTPINFDLAEKIVKEVAING